MTKHGLPIKERIQSSIVIDDNGCWIWQLSSRGPLRSTGRYGRIVVNGKNVAAHRCSYEVFVGPIPKGLHIDHLCGNPPCVNPEHLEPVTQAENSRRRAMANTHCPQGHEYTEQNTYWQPARKIGRNLSKQCKACRVFHNHKYYRSKLEPKDLTTISS
jgi:hypothetical protein